MLRWSPHSTPTKQPHAPSRCVGLDQLSTRDDALGPQALQGTEEGRSPCAYGEDAAEENDGVDAETAGTGPVRVGLEVEPEGELVECERRADAVTDRHEATE